MPLIKSGSRAAVSQNISEMVHAGHPQNQAVAAALSNARKYGAHMAGGGFAPPLGERYASRQLFHEGFLHSSVPGRTDKLPISVSGGAYVLPADHVAALGQGNSLAGANIVNKMFKMGPYGSGPTALKGTGAHIPHLNLAAKAPKFAEGGHEGHGKPTPIVAAGGEIVIPPHKIIERFGDLDHGHKALDQWVVETRKNHVKTLRKLKPPRKD
jgi:hypothetical protein